MGLSREQSSTSEGLLFSVSYVEEFFDEGEGDKQKNAYLDAVLDFVRCSQPCSDEGRSHHDHSPLKNLENASVNCSGLGEWGTKKTGVEGTMHTVGVTKRPTESMSNPLMRRRYTFPPLV